MGFFRNWQTIFQRSVPFYIPTSSVWGFWCFHICKDTIKLSAFFIIAISVGIKWQLIVALFCSLWWLMMLSIFSCAYCPFVYLPWKDVNQILCLFLNWVLLFLIIELLEFFMYSIYKSFIKYIYFAKFFSHFVGCLHFHDGVFWKTRVLILLMSYYWDLRILFIL